MGEITLAPALLVACVLVFIAQRSKPYYATAAMPMLLAAGAVVLERTTERRRLARTGAAVLLIAGTLPIVPMGLPLLPVGTFTRYTAGLGLLPANQERQELGALPQHFADMHGWEDLAREVSRVYQQLPTDEQATARVFAQNYGEAGALEYFALHGYPLPRVISPHNNYWYWGPGEEGGTLIVIGGRREDMEAVFEHVTDTGRTRCDYCMPYAGSMEAMKSKEFCDKFAKGPVVTMTVSAGGTMNMGGQLLQWFLYSVVISVFTAYLTGRVLPAGAHYLDVFRVAGTVTFMGYAMALPPFSIWYKRSWGTTIRSMADGLLYSLLTAGAFGWLWP